MCTYCLDRTHPRPRHDPPETSRARKEGWKEGRKKTVYWSLGFVLVVALLFMLRKIVGYP